MRTLSLTPIVSPITAEVSIPASKSYTNRALLIAAITGKKVVINNPLHSDDTKAMIMCLRTLGTTIVEQKNSLVVIGRFHELIDKEYILDCDLSAITLRFLLALCIAIPGTKILTGKEGLRKRPIKELVAALRSIGANITYLDQEGFPPVKIVRAQIQKHEVTVSGAMSSQYISSLMLIAPVIRGLIMHVIGKQVSKPYIIMTQHIMQHFGVTIRTENYSDYIVDPYKKYKAVDYTVESDFSSAAYFAAIATLTHSIITLKNCSNDSLQADTRFLTILKKMNTIINHDTNDITVIGKGVEPMTVDMTDCPDQIQTLAVLACFAQGITKITGISSLRLKETDRVASLQRELKKMGIRTKVAKNTLKIYGGNPQAATIETYGDHRMAMAFAVAGSKLAGMQIRNPEVVNKTFPEFWDRLKTIGIIITVTIPKKIVLIGFMGSGKSSLAPRIAQRLQLTAIEMDQLVIKESGRNSVAEIFTQDGEETFRTLERAVSEDLQDVTATVISTGGGVVTQESIMKNLQKDALTIFLSTSFETIQKRISHYRTRPLADDPIKTKALFEERLVLYNKYADIAFTTDSASLEELTTQIVERITT